MAPKERGRVIAKELESKKESRLEFRRMRQKEEYLLKTLTSDANLLHEDISYVRLQIGPSFQRTLEGDIYRPSLIQQAVQILEDCLRILRRYDELSLFVLTPREGFIIGLENMRMKEGRGSK